MHLKHLILDFNGTLAVDGVVIRGVLSRLKALGKTLDIHVVTADTFGTVQTAFQGVPLTVTVLPADAQDVAKENYVKMLGAPQCAAMGNGLNDHRMLKASALGICVVLKEGAAVKTFMAADVTTTSILDALDLLLHEKRITATLRK